LVGEAFRSREDNASLHTLQKPFGLKPRKKEKRRVG